MLVPVETAFLCMHSSWTAIKSYVYAGSVLVPVETAGRLLEVLLVLAGAWESQNLPQPLVLLTHVALTVLELARSQLEWLADGLSKALAAARGPINPFTCRWGPLVMWADSG